MEIVIICVIFWIIFFLIGIFTFNTSAMTESIKFTNQLKGTKTSITKGAIIFNKTIGILLILFSLSFLYNAFQYISGQEVSNVIISSTVTVFSSNRIEVFLGIIMILQGLVQFHPKTRTRLLIFFNVIRGVKSQITPTTILWSKITGFISIILGVLLLYFNLVLKTSLLLK